MGILLHSSPPTQPLPMPDRALEYATTALRVALRAYTGDDLDRGVAKRIATLVLQAADTAVRRAS